MPDSPSLDDVQAFLGALHGRPATGLESLAGGFWSSAFGYRVDGRELVARFGSVREGFEQDRAAMAFDRPHLPVPAVFEIGDAFGGAFAISERRHGRFLESVRVDQADVAGRTIVRLLGALRSVVPTTDDTRSWRAWLLEALEDDPQRRVSGWRATLAQIPEMDRLYRAGESRVRSLVEACPERRDLLHGDLLHGNVLVSDDADAVTAVFSWKCSARGDFLFDVAWCSFWGAFHEGIAAADVWSGVTGDPSLDASTHSLADAAARHHCYEVQIGTTHLGWNAWVGDEEGLRAVAAHLTMVLERGPLPEPTAAASSDVARLAGERGHAERLVADLGEELAGIIEVQEADPPDDEHDVEGSSVGFERARVTALLSAARAHVAELDSAAARMARGAYGRCESCGVLIAADRLEAIPSARRCVSCAAAPNRVLGR